MNNVKSFIGGFIVGVVVMGISACELGIRHGERQWFNGFNVAIKMHELNDTLEKIINEQENSEKRKRRA